MFRISRLYLVITAALCLLLLSASGRGDWLDKRQKGRLGGGADIACPSLDSFRAVIMDAFAPPAGGITVNIAWNVEAPPCNGIKILLETHDGQEVTDEDLRGSQSPNFHVTLPFSPSDIETYGRNFRLVLIAPHENGELRDIARPMDIHVLSTCQPRGPGYRLIPGIFTNAVVISSELDGALDVYGRLPAITANYPGLACEVDLLRHELLKFSPDPTAPTCFWQAIIDGELDTEVILGDEDSRVQVKGVQAGPGQCISKLDDRLQDSGASDPPGALQEAAPSSASLGLNLEVRCRDSLGDYGAAPCEASLDYSGKLAALAIAKIAGSLPGGISSDTVAEASQIIRFRMNSAESDIGSSLTCPVPTTLPVEASITSHTSFGQPSNDQQVHEDFCFADLAPSNTLLSGEGLIELDAAPSSKAFGETGNDFVIEVLGSGSCVEQLRMGLASRDFLTAREDGFMTQMATMKRSAATAKSQVGGVKLPDW